MSELLDLSIQAVKTAKTSFCRFITGNDAGTTGSHQAGFYIPKNAAPLLFGEKCHKGENREKWVTIKWQNDLETASRFIYYGQGTRNEYRITRFGKGFEFLQDRYVGSLIIIAEIDVDYYQAFVLESEDDIESFLSYFNLSTEQTNQIIDLSQARNEGDMLRLAIMERIKDLQDFPMTYEMGKMAQDIYNRLNNVTPEQIRKTPDKILMSWYSAEWELFRSLEEKVYKPIYTQPFDDCQSLIDFSNKILNRRKSRAGKSLEHHLSAIFDAEELIFEEQAVTEEKKKPDFLFPNSECYHNWEFPAEDLTVLGAKTTCKDRWRQVTTEADRVNEKYLFTLQPGISRNQLKEMASEKVLLVVPESHIKTFPEEYQSSLGTLGSFINLVKEKQARMPKHFLMRRGNKTVVDTSVQVEDVTDALTGKSKVEVNITNNFHEKVEQVINNKGGEKK